MKHHRRPFDDVRQALDTRLDTNPDAEGPTVRLDPGRAARTGVPEVIYAEHKSLGEITAALSRHADLTGRAIASRCSVEISAGVEAALAGRYQIVVHPLAQGVVAARPGSDVRPTGGKIAILSAGTSDRPMAAEAALIAREMGVSVEEVWDVGVAGLHRLVEPLERVIANGADAIVVAAGMDGALPSVVAGLVPVPVIGLPTSVGYGFGGGGVGALTSMLQTCAPGLVVVNIDNGIGAGATAALFANRVARARSVGDSVVFADERIDQRAHR